MVIVMIDQAPNSPAHSYGSCLSNQMPPNVINICYTDLLAEIDNEEREAGRRKRRHQWYAICASDTNEWHQVELISTARINLRHLLQVLRYHLLSLLLLYWLVGIVATSLHLNVWCRCGRWYTIIELIWQIRRPAAIKIR
jgi:hypothetical protein